MMDRDLDVLYISPWEREGGLATYSQYLVPNLQNYCNVSVVPWDAESLFTRGTGVQFLTVRFLKRLWNADVVHLQYTFGRYLGSLPVLLLLACLLRKPIVLTQHERFDNIPFGALIYRYHQVMCFFVDEIIVHTDSRKAMIADRHHSRISVVEHGVIYREGVDRKPSEVETVLFPGGLRPIKGHPLAIRAVEQVEGVTLRIVGGIGDEEYFQEIQTQIRESDASDRIQLRSEFVPEEELFQELREADLVVLPYEPHTSMSGILAHCISWQVPTIVTDCPAFRSVIPSDEVFLPERSGDGIARKIEDIGDDPEKQEKIIRKFESLSKKYSWVTVAQRTVEIYDDLYD